MARRSPLLALALAFCLISLTGLPPTAGFVAKVYIFNAAVQSELVWLVIVAVLNSVVAAYYYLRRGGRGRPRRGDSAHSPHLRCRAGRQRIRLILRRFRLHSNGYAALVPLDHVLACRLRLVEGLVTEVEEKLGVG